MQKRRKITEVVTASTGNHGSAVAYAAAALSLRWTVLLPKSPNRTKRARTADLGAAIMEPGKN
ncbi:MAG: pyridoxal-phosphate dependent enzyme [Acidobacteria bacterium]|nr:pyridoxal-phosphate dependent enzyme [Acidobacteriota bacterium]